MQSAECRMQRSRGAEGLKRTVLRGAGSLYRGCDNRLIVIHIMFKQIIQKTAILLSISSLFLLVKVNADNDSIIEENLSTPAETFIEENLSTSGETFIDATNNSTPKRLKITVNISSPEDLLIKEGEIIKKGEIISDRTRIRKQLEAQLKQARLSLNNIKSSKILAPVEPAAVPPMQNLPPANFAQEESAVKSAELEYQQAQRTYALALENDPFISSKAKVSKAQSQVQQAMTDVQNQGQKTAAIAQIKNLPPEVLTHEKNELREKQTKLSEKQAEFSLTQAELSQLKENRKLELQNLADRVSSARASLELAQAKLITARSRRSLIEYNHTITATRRIEEANQAQIAYNRQQQEYQQQRRDKEFKLTQLTNRIAEIEDKIEDIATVQSPYSGQIKKIKYENQTDNTIKVEITLIPQ